MEALWIGMAGDHSIFSWEVLSSVWHGFLCVELLGAMGLPLFNLCLIVAVAFVSQLCLAWLRLWTIVEDLLYGRFHGLFKSFVLRLWTACPLSLPWSCQAPGMLSHVVDSGCAGRQSQQSIKQIKKKD